MKRRLLAFLIVLLISIPLTAWRLRALYYRQPLVLTVVRPVAGDLQTAVTATGTLYPRHSIDIKYDGQEIVQQLNVKEGDHVKAGQILAVMDTRVLEHTRSQNLQTMEKDIASLVQAEAAFHREELLLKDGIVARADYEVTRATYESLIHQREADREAAAETAEQMERAVLRSPMNGTVIAIYVHSGEMLGSATAVAVVGPSASISKPTNVLMTVAEDGPLEVYADVNAADLASVAAGQLAYVSIDAFQPKVFHGRVRRIALEPVVVNNVTTYQAIVTLTDADPRFRIGLPSDVMLLRTIARSGALVPEKAIRSRSSGEVLCTTSGFAEVSSGRTLSRTPRFEAITVVAKTDDTAALSAGLPPDTWVVEDPAACESNTNAQFALQVASFTPNPSFAKSNLAKSKEATAITSLPPSKPKGWLQSILGL